MYDIKNQDLLWVAWPALGNFPISTLNHWRQRVPRIRDQKLANKLSGGFPIFFRL